MPAIYAHLRFGDEVVAYLPPSFRACAEKFPEAFHLGTQGPDILFYHQPMKKNEIRSFGMKMHVGQEGGIFFAKQAKQLSKDGVLRMEDGALVSTKEAAYLMGFLCHFTLDVHCHPLIDGNTSEKLTHGKIESEFDKYLLRLDGKPIRGYNTATPIQNTNGAAETCAKIIDIPLKEIELSIKTMRKINGWFSSKCEPFHGFAHFFLKIVKMERKFGDMFLHKKDDPLCKDLLPSLTEILKNTVKKAAAIIEEYFFSLSATAATERLENDLFRYNYSGIIHTEV